MVTAIIIIIITITTIIIAIIIIIMPVISLHVQTADSRNFLQVTQKLPRIHLLPGFEKKRCYVIDFNYSCPEKI
jgi:flagellar basal body-associated protein FliL